MNLIDWLLVCAIFVLIVFITVMLVKAMTSVKRPINEFAGRQFPHPLDENWSLSGFDREYDPWRFIHGEVLVDGCGNALRLGSTLYLNGHLIDQGKRVNEYMFTIRNSFLNEYSSRRLSQKLEALEKLPKYDS